MNRKLSSLSFFCPAYNDEKNLPALIPHVSEVLKEITDKYEIIIVHDGGNDRTGNVADELSKKIPHVRVIHHTKNLGYGATLREGFLTAKYDFIMYTDGDNQYDVGEFIPYLHLLEDHDVLSGYVKEKATSIRRKLQSSIYNVLIATLFFTGMRDINCAMKIYKRKVIRTIPIKSISGFIDAEMIIGSQRAGFRIAQFPVTHFPRSNGLASGSKMSVVLPTIIEMVKFRIGIL